ncbi:putative component of NuA3 histone acetyltransferase complex [Rhodotorula kratochvilovae]
MASSPPAEPAAKRQKTGDAPLPFHTTLLEPSNVARLRSAHEASTPYKHAVIDQLFDEDFVRRARKEITEQLSFREKETDIYKINQTGDLSNLSGLPAAELAVLPTLLELRDAIYSKTFRTFLQEVTGCGPLSGIKTDMSCAEYSEGCYLLNHDDVIGTRRISFILYLVLDKPAWQPEWGGALELYPVLEADEKNPDRPNVPVAKPSVVIPPSFNQMVFFEVQPGHSFHSVEEVVVEGDKEKGGVGARVSLSGWFHKPIEGEEGYEGSEGFKPKSSLQQLYATTLSAATPYPSLLPLPLPTIPSTAELAYLAPLINPAYLTPKVVSHLRTSFCESSHLVLADFLAPALAREIEELIRAQDAALETGRRGAVVGGSRVNKVPAHSTGEDAAAGWEVVGPPHLQRYLSLSSAAPAGASDRLAELLRQVHALFTSPAFAALLASLTSLLPTAHTTAVRRFRPGLDYTLARGEAASDAGASAKLDVGLGLTPKCAKIEDAQLWEAGDVGGWDIWLANEEGGDEATYGGAGEGKKEKSPEQEQDGEAEDAEEEEDDDAPLLALEPEWNRLHLVLRDPGVLAFVKYLSARAPASRWDVAGEWEVQGVEEDEEDEQ